jgi:ribosomal protein S8
MNIKNLVSILQTNIKKKVYKFLITIPKKHMEVIDILKHFGYLTYKVENNTSNSITCTIMLCYNQQQELLLQKIKVVSTDARKIYTKKHSRYLIANSRNIQTFILTSNGIFPCTTNIGGEILFKVIL